MVALLPLDDALSIIARVARPAAARDCAVHCPARDALGRTLARAVIAPYALPPFASTGVDGYALHPQDAAQTDFALAGASYAGASYAGAPLAGALRPGEAARIATGAVLPPGADRVVMQEQCSVAGGRVRLETLPPPGGNLRPAGADLAAGAEALPAGRRLRAQDLALLGALGIGTIAVRRPLKIAIFSTGAELAPPGRAPAPGQIVDTNAAMLRDLLAGDDAEVTPAGALPDDPVAVRAALLAAAATHDLLLTTGGVSVGDRDPVTAVLHAAGTVHFWRLAIRPGKPALFATLGDALVLALPGNPVSAFVTFLLLVRPLLAALRGGIAELPPAYEVKLATAIDKNFPLRAFSRVRLRAADGSLLAEVDREQGSNLYTSLTRADGLLDLPETPRHYEAGDTALFRPFAGLLGS